jgi:Cu/Ag efflux protein CusF
MKFRITALASVAAIAALAAGCKTAPPEPVTVEKIDSIAATVTAVDVKKRLVSLRGPDGATATIEVPSDVRNLAQVKVGDKLVVRYYESMGAALRPKGAPPTDTSTIDQAAAAGRAPAGSKPGAAVGSVTTTTVVIHSVDKKSSTVTFTGPDGYARVLPVKDPAAKKFVATLKEGDQVDLTYTEALAVSVEPAR